MISILRHRVFRRLFTAQVVALLGTGLLTVALALLAYDLAGERAGAVLGTALTIKMLVYVLLAPLSGALVPPERRKAALITFDLLRVCIALALPFVSEVWQIYLLIALLQSASAGFTPLFQSLIPEVLPDEREYTRALSLSRMAYDLENLISPLLAAALLAWVHFHTLFMATAIGFAVSAGLILAAAFPKTRTGAHQGRLGERLMVGTRIYLRTPRLRGLLALHLCAAAGGAMVFVNTVVLVKGELLGTEQHVALAFAAFGGGSMLTALLLPRILDRVTDRQVMLTAAGLMVLTLLTAAVIWTPSPTWQGWATLLVAWGVVGVAYSGLVTPGGRLLRRSARDADLPAVFATQFSLSHACWLLAYPLAGWIGLTFGSGVVLAVLGGVAATGWILAIRGWPADDQSIRLHTHDDLNPDHPHMRAHGVAPHAHPFVIDTVHRRWPG